MTDLRGEGDLLPILQTQMTIAETHELIMAKVVTVTILETVVIHQKMRKAGVGAEAEARLRKSLASAIDLCNATCLLAGAGETPRLFPRLSSERSKRPLTGLIVKI